MLSWFGRLAPHERFGDICIAKTQVPRMVISAAAPQPSGPTSA